MRVQVVLLAASKIADLEDPRGPLERVQHPKHPQTLIWLMFLPRSRDTQVHTHSSGDRGRKVDTFILHYTTLSAYYIPCCNHSTSLSESAKPPGPTSSSACTGREIVQHLGFQGQALRQTLRWRSRHPRSQGTCRGALKKGKYFEAGCFERLTLRVVQTTARKTGLVKRRIGSAGQPPQFWLSNIL